MSVGPGDAEIGRYAGTGRRPEEQEIGRGGQAGQGEKDREGPEPPSGRKLANGGRAREGRPLGQPLVDLVLVGEDLGLGIPLEPVDGEPVALLPADASADVAVEVGADLLPGGQDALFLAVGSHVRGPLRGVIQGIEGRL